MRFTFVLTAFVGALATASAARISGPGLMKRQFPNCAMSCLENADTGSCNSSDDTCLCNNAAFVNSVTSCIASSCTGSELTEADADAQQLCLAVGVTLTASAPASTSSGSSAAPSSTAPTSASPSSTAPTSASPSPSASTTKSGAMSHGLSAFAGLVAVGAVALNL